MITPFLKAKIRDRIHVVSQEQVLEQLPHNRVPKFLGGIEETSDEVQLHRFRSTLAKLRHVQECWTQRGGL